MAQLAITTKELDFHLEQVQDFTPTPMTIATETWYTGYDPYTLEKVFSAKSPHEKEAQRQFFFWYKPEERQRIERTLRDIGRPDLIPRLFTRTSAAPSSHRRAGHGHDAASGDAPRQHTHTTPSTPHKAGTHTPPQGRRRGRGSR